MYQNVEIWHAIVNACQIKKILLLFVHKLGQTTKVFFLSKNYLRGRLIRKKTKTHCV